MTKAETIQALAIPNASEGAVGAPVVYFEQVSASGATHGVGKITLEALVMETDANGVVYRRKIVAHLAGAAAAFEALRSTIVSMQTMSAKPEHGQKPN